jgi:ABC-2 type transport system ATP-binding protein
MHPPVAVRVENAAKAFSLQPHRPLTRIALGFGAARAPLGVPGAVVALAGISLEVRAGEILGLVGPNSSGKTTLLRLMAAQLAPDAGRAAVLDGPAPAPHPAFIPKLSPVENLLYGARQYALRPAETRRQVLDLLGRLGLPADALFRPMEGLSRGAQQMVLIARSFLAEPRLLLLDEPTASLDPRARRAVHALIRELREQIGATVVLATHDLDEAETLCDRVAVLNRGRLLAVDTPAALRQRAGTATLEDAFLSLTGRPLPAEEDAA